MEPVTNITLLFVDDEPLILRSLKRALQNEPYTVFIAQSGEEGLALLEQHPIDVVVSDKMMPNMSGIEFLAQVAERFPDTIRMMLTAFTEVEDLIDAINQGKVWGYMQKPFDMSNIKLTLEQAIQTKMLVAERNMLRASLQRYRSSIRSQFYRFVGDSIAMQMVYKAIEKAGPSQANVFITGPSGTGKELAADAIHRASTRKDKPLVCINCAAIPSELMESEIFGHIKGAFSGAVTNRDGAATQADGGTLFLDEIGEMDMNLQAKILRFVQSGTFQKVGSGKEEKVDVRFICATNREPHQAIADQRLREDLFYRLNVIAIDLPALHERDHDALQIAQHFLSKFSELENKVFVGFSPAAEQLILNYDWPGNVRQLENLVHSCVVMSDGPLITKDTLQMQLKLKPSDAQALLNGQSGGSGPIQSRAPQQSVSVQENGYASPQQAADIPSENQICSLAEVERIAIEKAIAACDDNVVKAASLLEVSPSTLYRKIQQWGDKNTGA
ncbi:sigma-54-dependent Fis family transcriptional regulator [Pseudoalteromonas rubra]|uniref:Sigma-54-dependent Fis family transcriptional regulator n=1 Tax=Pseudoalteromonas rubra TaxID=43658 RepID=A0A5S3WP50_9GAMM|nr:sigma-54 dependent transcriptional regulator [Pseudoalteromonas rubra]TMP29305.1 sigma-54-dependent Fis family transcriptional regulator [Pseudoalteromonas rubra]TMP34090.1 sigma-54-dependent Fis family transcriptional regulator [Pseudoalteromonas rubra]